MINSKLKQSISKNSIKLWPVCLLTLGMVIVAFIIFLKMPIAFYKAGDGMYTKNALEPYQVLILEVYNGQHRLIADNDGLNEAKALIDNLTVMPTPIAYDRDSPRGHQMIFIDAENNVKKLCFSLDYKEVWYDNGVKPGRHYVTNEPIVLKRYFEQQLSKNVPNSLQPMFSVESLNRANYAIYIPFTASGLGVAGSY